MHATKIPGNPIGLTAMPKPSVAPRKKTASEPLAALPLVAPYSEVPAERHFEMEPSGGGPGLRTLRNREAAWLVALPVAAALAVFLPVIQNPFIYDEFIQLYNLVNFGPLELLLTPHGGHLLFSATSSTFPSTNSSACVRPRITPSLSSRTW